MQKNKEKIAIVGSGVSGLSAAWHLKNVGHDVEVFEAADYIGGHVNTINVDTPKGPKPVDTGFIVFNEPNYPNFTRLLKHLGIASAGSDMSFAVSLNKGQFEYAGGPAAGLLAQKKNVFSPRFWRMVKDILKLYRDTETLDPDAFPAEMTVADFVSKHGYGPAMLDLHLKPFIAAVWSTPEAGALDFPFKSFLRFCQHHGLLQVSDRPRWRTVLGGSRTYVDEIIKPFKNSIHTGTKITAIKRTGKGVTLTDANGKTYKAGQVVIATHADHALAMLEAPSAEEQSLLGAFQYSQNTAILHGDASAMPKRKAAWASWNVLSRSDKPDAPVCVSYWMNKLQRLGDMDDVFVTLNPNLEIDKKLIHKEISYTHPIFDVPALKAQMEIWSLQGQNRTWFCGAHCGYGFHEDGLQSGLAVAEEISGIARPWQVKGASDRVLGLKEGSTTTALQPFAAAAE